MQADKHTLSQLDVASQIQTRKAQLTQRGTCNSSACMKARCEPSNVSFTLSLGRIGWKSLIFPTPLSFSALARGDPFRIYGKALQIMKLESSRQPTVKNWWSLLVPFWTDPPV